MVRYISLLLFIGLSLGQNLVVAVFDFENNGLNDAQVRQVTSRLESELDKAGGLMIVERKQINDQQTAGFKSVQWDATNNQGQPVSAGLYLYTIQAGKFRQTKKMVLLK